MYALSWFWDRHWLVVNCAFLVLTPLEFCCMSLLAFWRTSYSFFLVGNYVICEYDSFPSPTPTS